MPHRQSVLTLLSRAVKAGWTAGMRNLATDLTAVPADAELEGMVSAVRFPSLGRSSLALRRSVLCWPLHYATVCTRAHASCACVWLLDGRLTGYRSETRTAGEFAIHFLQLADAVDRSAALVAALFGRVDIIERLTAVTALPLRLRALLLVARDSAERHSAAVLVVICLPPSATADDGWTLICWCSLLCSCRPDARGIRPSRG
jgi:hypothetical protein